MKADLTGVKDALASLTDTELQALIIATSEAPRIAHGLLVWIQGACAWELNRRVGRNHDLLPPEASVDPGEEDASIEAVYAMRASFVASDLAPAALRFFDALVGLLTGTGERH